MVFVVSTLEELNSAGGIQLDGTYHQVPMEAWDGKAQLDSSLHQAAVVALAGGN